MFAVMHAAMFATMPAKMLATILAASRWGGSSKRPPFISRGVPPQWAPRRPPAGRASHLRFPARELIANLAVCFGSRMPIRGAWRRLEDFQ
eukprot:9221844-Alexandrium_andersonii.AAC.1